MTDVSFDGNAPRLSVASATDKSVLGEMFVWQDDVAGTDPTDVAGTDPTDIADRFTATIRMEGETPVVEWSPKLSEAEAVRRRYTVYGKTRLSDAQGAQSSRMKRRTSTSSRSPSGCNRGRCESGEWRLVD